MLAETVEGPAIATHGLRTERRYLRSTKARFSIASRKKFMAVVEVKHYPPILHGELIELEPELDQGWILVDDVRRICFRRDSLTSQEWDRLATGTRLRFREMDGEQGPYAAAVTIAERA